MSDYIVSGENEVGAYGQKVFEKVYFSNKSYEITGGAQFAFNFFDESGLYDGKNVKGNIQSPNKFTDGQFYWQAMGLCFQHVTVASGFIPVAEENDTIAIITNAIIFNSIIRVSEVNTKIIDIPLVDLLIPSIKMNPAAGASTAATMGMKDEKSIRGKKVLNVPNRFERDQTFTCQWIGWNPSGSSANINMTLMMMGRYVQV